MSSEIEAYTLREMANATGIDNLYIGAECLYTVDHPSVDGSMLHLSIHSDLNLAVGDFEYKSSLIKTASDFIGPVRMYQCYYDSQHKQLKRLRELRISKG